jgi:hypothetical protein
MVDQGYTIRYDIVQDLLGCSDGTIDIPFLFKCPFT